MHLFSNLPRQNLLDLPVSLLKIADEIRSDLCPYIATFPFMQIKGCKFYFLQLHADAVALTKFLDLKNIEI